MERRQYIEALVLRKRVWGPIMIKTKIAKSIRIVTVPPVLAAVMLLILHGRYGGAFASDHELIAAVLLLAVTPMLAYPVAAVCKGRDRRKTERKLAFLFNLIGYLCALLSGLIFHYSHMLMTIFAAYAAAVVLLTLLNRLTAIRASGHACSCVLPYLFLVRWLEPWVLLILVPLYAAEFWASVELKRHTVPEFLWGSMVAAVSFTLSLLV